MHMNKRKSWNVYSCLSSSTIARGKAIWNHCTLTTYAPTYGIRSVAHGIRDSTNGKPSPWHWKQLTRRTDNRQVTTGDGTCEHPLDSIFNFHGTEQPIVSSFIFDPHSSRQGFTRIRVSQRSRYGYAPAIRFAIVDSCCVRCHQCYRLSPELSQRSYQSMRRKCLIMLDQELLQARSPESIRS
jgi:hypothetical protein